MFTVDIKQQYNNNTTTLLDALKLNHHLSFVHYNVQSIASKLDILQTELFDFHALAFTETWLHPGITIDDLLIESFNNSERITESTTDTEASFYM